MGAGEFIVTGRVNQPAPEAKRSDRCAFLGHPGVTFNPWVDRTWCRCGVMVYPGRTVTVDEHVACCGGPLTGPGVAS